jgi:prepilin-type N-terminal cleavage/methylation domain-containing protein/prepilin-type processing-associated H-X9-DG protein
LAGATAVGALPRGHNGEPEGKEMIPMQKHGFTLIELLVVIAIIAILAAILFPVFAQARDKARSSACLSNTKQIGTGILMYVQDYDETLPEYWDDNVAKTPNGLPLGYWHNRIQPYVKSYQVFICPSAQSKDERLVDTGEGTPAQRKDLRWRGSGSYGWNYWYLGAWPGQIFTLAQVSAPAETIAVGESTRLVNPGVIYPAPTCAGNPSWAGAIKSEKDRQKYWTQFGARHQEGNNLVFVDGHAKWLKRSTVESHPELFYSLR